MTKIIKINPQRISQKNSNKTIAAETEKKVLEPAQELIEKILKKSKIIEDGMKFEDIEELTQRDIPNSNVRSYGFRVRPFNGAKQIILELVATKNSDTERTTSFLPACIGTKTEIMAKLKDKNLISELKSHVKESGIKFLLED